MEFNLTRDAAFILSSRPLPTIPPMPGAWVNPCDMFLGRIRFREIWGREVIEVAANQKPSERLLGKYAIWNRDLDSWQHFLGPNFCCICDSWVENAPIHFGGVHDLNFWEGILGGSRGARPRGRPAQLRNSERGAPDSEIPKNQINDVRCEIQPSHRLPSVVCPSWKFCSARHSKCNHNACYRMFNVQWIGDIYSSTIGENRFCLTKIT
jgi:hypothetical protein